MLLQPNGTRGWSWLRERGSLLARDQWWTALAGTLALAFTLTGLIAVSLSVAEARAADVHPGDTLPADADLVAASIRVDGRCNIFGAGHATPPSPGGGGAGLLPIVIDLPSNTVGVKFLAVSGNTSCCGGEDPNGPDGGTVRGSTNIFSHGGISGIQFLGRYSFLTGVFLDATEPSGAAPDRLDFGPSGLTDSFTELLPGLRQTFFIGDGHTPSAQVQTFQVPAGATRLFLGFVDGLGFSGEPGFYDDNTGFFDAEVEIVLEAPSNNAPDCSAARAVTQELWPPNHEFAPIEITGVTDPDGDPVTITVTGVKQDEPLNEEGDGNTCPDAVLENGAVQVRAERSGGGNGRVYEIVFTASDGRGGSCRGSVLLCVPHDQDGDACVDDGQTFNSLGPCAQDDHVDDDGVADVTLTAEPRIGNTTTLEYALPEASQVLITVYDVAGRRVATLEHGARSAGAHAVSWNTAGVARGIYFYRLQAGRVTVTRSVLVLNK